MFQFRDDGMPVHFRSAHGGQMRALAEIKFCTKCGALEDCERCSPNMENKEWEELEKMLRHNLGFDRKGGTRLRENAGTSGTRR